MYSSSLCRESTLTQFASFWKPVMMLDTNIWQKWVHSHRIGLVMEQDLPLPKYLHVPNSSGRYNILQCRQAFASLTQLLRGWATFVMAENHSYIKFLSRLVKGFKSLFHFVHTLLVDGYFFLAKNYS